MGQRSRRNASRDKFRDREWLDKREKEEIEAIEEAFKKMDEIDEEEDRIFGVDKRGDELPEDLSDPRERFVR